MMNDTIRKFEETMNEVNTELLTMCSKPEYIKSMDSEEFTLMKLMFKLIDVSTELTVKQAKMINEINTKLDLMDKL